MATEYDHVPSQPWEHAVYHAIRSAPLSPRQRAIVAAHLFQPTVSARQLMRTLQVGLAEVKAAYRWLQGAPAVHQYTTSPFYARRLLYAFARETIGDWLADPAYARRLLQGEPVASRVVEIHATPGSCQYRCAMCLWSDKQEFTYARQGLAAARYLDADTWLRTLAALREYGAHTVVLSGGGEPLLHPELPRLIRRAGALGYRVHLYTNGFNLARQADALTGALLAADRVRVSLHSPHPTTYDQIVGLPARAQALAQVSQGLRQLLAARDASGSPLQVGIGFVVQPLNVHEVAAMCAFARDVGVDFLNIRQDEVAVTTLTPSQRQHLRAQLVAVRQALVAGDYAGVHIDFSDDLTALANGEPAVSGRAGACFAKYYRPAISPFGLVAACDLIAEPRFATAARTFGSIVAQPIAQILATLPRRHLSADCVQCMPSGRSGNLVYEKLLQDSQLGLDFAEQPFAAPPPTPTNV
ncbi:MAG TPA: radical SAM protein [Chloroflexota bacterium]|jgi:MoaA/NifB/PqqE/SkfB family radical SAM enzyme|nr:radical SAM protein [Chloroflexota bacterium]